MINLLPPAIKEEIAYAKRNARLIKSVELLTVASMIIALLLVGARITAQSRNESALNELSSIKESAKENAAVEKDARAVSEQLKTIKKIRTDQRRYSAVIRDLAELLPGGTSISDITLTGKDNEPLALTVTAPNYSTARQVRGSLASSSRIAAIDVISITSASDNRYTVRVDIAFKPGLQK